MTRTPLKMYAIALAAVLMAAPAFAAKKEKAAESGASAGTVNGKPLPQNIINFIVDMQKTRGQADSPELRNKIRDVVINQQLLVQEAQKQGLDKKSGVQAQMDLARQDVLIKAYIDGYVNAHPVSEDAVKKEYEAVKSQLGEKEFKVRHILVDSEDDAKAIIAKLKKGEKFETLSAQSKDPGSKDKGGDLGWSVPSAYVKPFADAMQALNKGQYTEAPVKSDFGWHVIQLDDTRALKLPAFDEAKPQIQQRLQQQMVEKHVAELRSKAKVE